MIGPQKFSDRTEHWLTVLFPVEAERDQARVMLLSAWSGSLLSREHPDRLNGAALKLSDGKLEKLRKAIEIGRRDYRDLLVWSGFAVNVHYEDWMPEK